MFWWPGIKKDIIEFVFGCVAGQKSKIGHQKPSRLMQPLDILEWKWDDISVDFVTSLPKTSKGNDSIWVIMDKLTKSAHFILIKINYPLHKLAELYIEKVVSLHGIPSSIILNRDLRFTSSIGMTLFEALYDRRCRTPLCWYDLGESVVLGPEIVQQTTEKIKMIQEKMKASQTLQKSYHDKKRKSLKFREGDHAFLRVTLVTGVGCALKSNKLTMKYIHDLSHVIQLDGVLVRENLKVETLPLRIEDREVKRLRGKEIVSMKVSHDFSEGTNDLSQAHSGGLELRVGVHGLEIGLGSTTTENAYNDGYKTHIMKASRLLLGSV
ncbi:uncharacterized protein LOC127095149 [Lathyrus oleraceus]|uniref:uncharacterized protein LOC127095149 n=1 Tax=Pisum sativum TaxID=3888 RepID=UPI0021D2F02E|nr:uncharacterized protein LOC127095149 [Pisum sativum]